MGYLGDKGFLLLIEAGLPVPEEKDDVYSDEYDKKQEDPLGEDNPVILAVPYQVGSVIFHKSPELLVLSNEPVDPEYDNENPDQLDGDERNEGMKQALK
jgi:hypothetical protein